MYFVVSAFHLIFLLDRNKGDTSSKMSVLSLQREKQFTYYIQSLEDDPVSVSEDLDHFPFFPFVLPRKNLNLRKTCKPDV